MRTAAPVNVIVYHPKTEAGRRALAICVADVHTAAVHQRIQKLTCPTAQKLALLDAVIDTATRRSGEQPV